MPDVELFKGTDRRKENPQNWLRKLEGSKFKFDTADEQRIYTFSKHLDYGSKADIWFRTELTPHDKTSWAALEAAFHSKWPPLTRAVPSAEEKQVELCTLKLSEEEIGTKVGEDEDDQVWAHVDWALRVQALAEDIGDDKGMLISIARNNLPVSIRTLLPNDISTWQRFTDGVCNVSLSRLVDEADRDRTIKAASDAIANLTISSPPPRSNSVNYNRTPYHTPYQRLLPETPLTPTPPQRPNPTAPNPSTFTTPPFTPRSNAGNTLVNTNASTTPLASGNAGFVTLAQQAMANNQPFPNTEEGRRKYTAAVARWLQKYGNVRPDWGTDHFPLTPGTSPLGSAECYLCGKAGHRRDNCPPTSIPIPDNEANLRARINGLVRGRVRFAESPGALPVFIIDAEEVAIDTNVYDTSSLQFRDEENQGNE
jgi:hypothetical protein